DELPDAVRAVERPRRRLFVRDAGQELAERRPMPHRSADRALDVIRQQPSRGIVPVVHVPSTPTLRAARTSMIPVMLTLNFALRTRSKTPFVPAVAILPRALGIGATAAIFSMFNQLLLRPLPVRAPAALVNVQSPGPKPGSVSCGSAGPCDFVFSYAMFR